MRPRPGRTAYSATALCLALTRPTDVVFCGHLYMAPLAVLIARLSRAKLIMQMMGLRLGLDLHGFVGWPSHSADLILCVSRHTREAVLAWASIAPERVIVLPNTVRDAFTVGDGSMLRAKIGTEWQTCSPDRRPVRFTPAPQRT